MRRKVKLLIMLTLVALQLLACQPQTVIIYQDPAEHAAPATKDSRSSIVVEATRKVQATATAEGPKFPHGVVRFVDWDYGIVCYRERYNETMACVYVPGLRDSGE